MTRNSYLFRPGLAAAAIAAVLALPFVGDALAQEKFSYGRPLVVQAAEPPEIGNGTLSPMTAWVLAHGAPQ